MILHQTIERIERNASIAQLPTNNPRYKEKDQTACIKNQTQKVHDPRKEQIT